MASTVDKQAAEAGWASGLQSGLSLLGTRYGALRLYQWLWLLFCLLAALAAAAPRVLSQPIIYLASGEMRFDTQRYGGIYNPVGPNVTGLQVAIGDANEVLRQNALARRELRFGLPNYRVEFVPAANGIVQVRGLAPTASEAKALADAGAEELARQVRAAGGREILRNLLGWELYLALEPQGTPAPTAFDVLLREVIRQQAFPMSRPLEPFSTPRSLDMLSREEQLDAARALESRYDLWRFAINTRNATLDTLCAVPNTLTTGQREALLATCAEQNPAARAELSERDAEIRRLRAVEGALNYLINQEGMVFRPDEVGAAYRIAAPLPAAAEPRYTLPLIGLAAALGLGLGLFGVWVDRSAGVARKVRQIWGYRELVRNLVLRDLRARYKGSALGYLWTQIAPLLTMSVFVFIFSLVLPSSIALYPVFLIVALLPWNYASEAVGASTGSIINNANLIKKVYFPREILPLVSVLSSLVNYLLSLPMMFAIIVVVQLLTLGRLNLAWTLAYLPVLLVIQTVFLSGLALLLSALAVFFRDIVHLIGILINLWFFMTPVFYALDTLGGGTAARILRWINPMASLIEFYREIVYGNPVAIGLVPTPGLPALASVLRVAVTALVILALGYWFFQKNSGKFGEEI
jgi:lipopolysaccharide transport system permease protein